MSGLVALIPLAVGWAYAFHYLGAWGFAVIAASVLGVVFLTTSV